MPGRPAGSGSRRSGVYYLPFAQPDGPLGAGTVALHVADGSEIVSQRVGGPALEVSVAGGPYGACLARLTPATLADGWLPILETRYSGYTQESFAARIPETRSLVSFVRVTGPGRDPAHADGARAQTVGQPARARLADIRRARERSPLDGALARLPRGRLRGLAHAGRPVPSLAARSAAVRPGARVGRHLLAKPARRGREPRGARAARHGRAARVARPESRAVMALQHRQRLRGGVVPGEPRPGAGDGRARVRRGRRDDRSGLAHPPGDSLSELDDGGEAARRRRLRPARRRPSLPDRRDSRRSPAT